MGKWKTYEYLTFINCYMHKLEFKAVSMILD